MSTLLLRLKAVMDMRGRSHSSTYNDIKAGLLTAPIRIGRNAVGWPDYEIEQLNRARIASSSDDEIRALVDQLHAARGAEGEAAAAAHVSKPTRAAVKQRFAPAGATLRDLFAMAAVAGLMAAPDQPMSDTELADCAYSIADECLKARGSQDPQGPRADINATSSTP